jgi:serine/threonine protein kinase
MSGQNLKSILVNIYLGLEDIHQHQQPHLNLMPSNVLINSKDRAKISNVGLTLPEFKKDISNFFSSIRKAKKRTRLVSIEFDDPRSSEFLMGGNSKENLRLPEFFKFISPECLESTFPLNVVNFFNSTSKTNTNGHNSSARGSNMAQNLLCVDVWAFGMIALFLFFPSLYMSLKSNRVKRSVDEIKWSMMAQRLNPDCVEFKALNLIE